MSSILIILEINSKSFILNKTSANFKYTLSTGKTEHNFLSIVNPLVLSKFLFRHSFSSILHNVSSIYSSLYLDISHSISSIVLNIYILLIYYIRFR